MVSQFTEAEIKLLIGDLLIKNDCKSVDDVLRAIFGAEKSNLPSVIKEFVTQETIRHVKSLLSHSIKNWIGINLKRRSRDFIKNFVAAQKADKLSTILTKDALDKLAFLETCDAVGSLLVECSRLFNALRRKYAPGEDEDRFRIFLTQWLQNSFMPLSIWKIFEQWNKNGYTLSALRNIRWPDGSNRDSNWQELQRLIQRIKTDDFVEREKLQTVLKLLLVPPEFRFEEKTVKLIGRTIYLSEWRNQIESEIYNKDATRVAIYPEDSLIINCDLTSDIWQGKNLIIATTSVCVQTESRIRLSGKGFLPGKTKATSARRTSETGANGKDGKAGESSGNISILSAKMYNPGKLTVELNGGRGEDGQDGGDGYDGENGSSVSQADLQKLVVSYSSLYRDSWSNFDNYSPPSNWSKESDNRSSGEYIYRTYKDENGRTMTYSFAADKGWTYTTYEIYLLICGSKGTSGSSGGSNGIGGQGGYNGTSFVQNPENGQPFQINIIKQGKSSGPNGENGVIGKSGRHGINGNDMALIDRSAQEASKHYEGSNDRKLSWNYVYKAEAKSRLNGYRRYSQKESACFIKFGAGEAIDTSERRATTAKERITRTSTSEAVAKQSIVISQVLTETRALFGKQSALLAEACKATAEVTVNSNEDEEEAEVENVTEEVVVLRQKEEVNTLIKYTPESEKKQRPTHTPETFVNHLKSVDRHTMTINTCSQILFDLFTIEFPPELLNSIVLHTIFQQSYYRRMMQSSFSKLFVSALQSKVVNGKTYNDINEFTTTLSQRRKRKIDSSRLRLNLGMIPSRIDSVQVKPSSLVKSGAEKLFGIASSALSPLLAPYQDEVQVKEFVKLFYSLYLDNEVSPAMLSAFNTFLKVIDPIYISLLESLEMNDPFGKKDEGTSTNYLTSMTNWFSVKIGSEKKAEQVASTAVKNEIPQVTNDSESAKSKADFENFRKAVGANMNTWAQIVKPVGDLISKNSEYAARFGSPPSFDKSGLLEAAKARIQSSSDEEKFIDQTRYVIKIYSLAKAILKYNRMLYICNALMLTEQNNFKEPISFNDGDNYDNFLAQLSRTPVQSDSDSCENYMKTRGLRCSSFRYLLSLHLNVKLCSYKQVSHQTLALIETMNPTATQSELLWLKDEHQTCGITADVNFRTLIVAQKALLTSYQKELSSEVDEYVTMDYTQKDNQTKLASFFSEPLRSAVLEWIENYIAITKDQSFLHLLHNRFWIDGCHLSVFELQFLLISWTYLRRIYHCDLNYLLLLCSAGTQLQLIDFFLYTRIEYQLGKRFDAQSKIFTGIQAIESTRFKALLAVKMSQYESSISEEDLYKLILMLQHASNGSEQLINIGLGEWIEIARKQKWSEIGYLLKKYGSIGYYLGVLDNHGFKKEEEKLRTIIDQVNIIPEKLIALYTHWIVTREVEGNDRFFDNVRKILTKANNYPGLKQTEAKYQLVTSEIEQTRLINWISTGKITGEAMNYDDFTSKQDRTVDELKEKIIGLHDTPEEAKNRRTHIHAIAQLLQSNDPKKSNRIQWLNYFDDTLFKWNGKRLRPAQKMAVLCAVESTKHVLEQVNTGEGKSFIIAAIATIRRKTGDRYVDIITSSPVLAERDVGDLSELYKKLGLNAAHNCDENLEARKTAYTADIVYGDIAHFQRDYLLHTFYKKTLRGDRTRAAVIVDEVDNMLLDNGSNMLYLSHNVPGMNLLDSVLIFIQQKIYDPIYTGEKNTVEKMQQKFENANIARTVLADIFGQFSLNDLHQLVKRSLNEAQISAIFDKLIDKEVIDADGYLKIHHHDQLQLINKALSSIDGALINQIQACFAVILSRERSIELPAYLRPFVRLHLDELIENCKQALFLEPDTGYVIDVDHTRKLSSSLEPLITIIDPNTGADLATSQWCGGLHQFLQLKHGCRITPISLKAVFISNVAYLKGYEHINGLSGTLGSTEESKTLIEMYGADLIKIPTSKRKVFYENVPVVTTNKQEWIDNIYQEICDQVIGSRSVLLICENIKQLEYIQDGLKTCFQADKNLSREVRECFANITVYKREHDDFGFEGKKEFQPYRLIIATNLAGRGTDIKLSKSLITAGGLHVITSFMPKNCRIEEQAFGRAARSAQPGSAQIIAHAEPVDNNAEISVFQLKTFRDNAEVHRLQSLKSFYDFHTEVEESCLEKFRSYCDKALTAIYSNASTSKDDSLPTASQVVYFALLDQWALWLDSKASLIKQCAKEHSKQLKDTLINSVSDFLEKHPFSDSSSCYDTAKAWINAPQSLLTIGLIQMHHEDGFEEAENTFNGVLADGHEFGAEAYYYKACMRMKNFNATRPQQKSLVLAKKKAFQENIQEAIELFYKSRTLFLHRLQRKQRESTVVLQMIEKSPANNPKTSGFESQQKSMITYIQLVLNNIDYLLGSSCEPNMFAADQIDENYSKKIYDAFCRQGIIGPTVLTDRPIENWQVEHFRQNYKLHRKQLETLVEQITNDPYTQKFDNRVVFQKPMILEKFPLSSKGEFWAELEQQGVLYDTEFYLVVSDRTLLSAQSQKLLDILTPFTPTDPEEVRTLLRYSEEMDVGTIYKLNDIKKITEENSKFNDEINQLLSSGKFKLDKMSKILIIPEQISYFSDFDGVTTDDFREYFNLTPQGAGWILNTLKENGVLMLQSVQMVRFTTDKARWEKLVRAQLSTDTKAPNNEDSLELKLLYENAGTLQQLKDNRRLLNITQDVINRYCRVPAECNKDEALTKFYAYLTDEKVLEPYIYNVWRLDSKLDCSSLPGCIINHLDDFFSDRFAYTFALEELCQSVEARNKDLAPTPNRIFLPETPFGTVLTDFVNCGLAMPSKFVSSTEFLNDIDYNDFQHSEIIKTIVNSNRMKLHDQTDYHLALIPFSTYVLDQEPLMDSDLKSIIDNGLKAVIAKKKEKTGWWLLTKLVAGVSWCWRKIKSIVNAALSFGYSALQFVQSVTGKVFTAVTGFLSTCAAKVGKFMMHVAEKMFGKTIVQGTVSLLQTGAEFAGYLGVKALEATEWCIDKGTKIVNYVGKKATEFVNYIGSSRVVQGTVSGVKSLGSWVASTSVWQSLISLTTYVYTQMSNFCTAVMESYRYYNQCRTQSRKLVNENPILSDEHTVLQMFHGISQQEAKNAIAEEKEDNWVHNHIRAWRAPILNSLLSCLDKKLRTLSENLYQVNLIKSVLKSSSVWKNLQNELNQSLHLYARLMQIACFANIRSTIEKNQPLESIRVEPIHGLPDEFKFFIEEAMDEILEELKNGKDDQGYDSDSEVNSGPAIDILLRHEGYPSWKDALITSVGKLIGISVDSILIEPSIKIILNYLSGVREMNMPPSATQLSFNKEDKNLKQALIEYKSSNESKRKTQFLMNELYSIVKQVFGYTINDHDVDIVKCAIRYGYPIPISAARFLISLMDTFLTNKNIYSAGINLEIFDNSQQIVFQFKIKDGKARMKLKHFDGFIFLCQTDYRNYASIANQTTDEVEKIFCYEAFIGHMKNLREKFPKKAETLRAGLLEIIEST